MSVYITLVVLLCSILHNTSAQGCIGTDAPAALATLEFRAENQTKPCHGLLLSSEWFITKKGCTKRKPGFEVLKVNGKEVSSLIGVFSEGHFGGSADKEEARNYELLRTSVPILLEEKEEPHDVLTKEKKQSFEVIQKAIKERCGGPRKDALVKAVLEGVGLQAQDLNKSICEQQWEKAPMAMSKRSVFGVPEMKGGFAKVIFGPGRPSDEPADPGFNGIGDTDTLIGYGYAEPEIPYSPIQVSPAPNLARPSVHYMPSGSLPGPFGPQGGRQPSKSSAQRSLHHHSISHHEQPHHIRVMGAPGLLGVWGAPGLFGEQAQEQYAAAPGTRGFADESYEPATRHSFNQAANYNIDESVTNAVAPAAPALAAPLAPVGPAAVANHVGPGAINPGYPGYAPAGYPSAPAGYLPAPAVPVPGYPGYIYPPYAPLGAPGQGIANNAGGLNLGFIGSQNSRKAASTPALAEDLEDDTEAEITPADVVIEAA